MSARTQGAISLRPCDSASGGYYFLSLSTGRRLLRQRWTELPLTEGVIHDVEHLGSNAMTLPDDAMEIESGVRDPLYLPAVDRSPRRDIRLTGVADITPEELDDLQAGILQMTRDQNANVNEVEGLDVAQAYHHVDMGAEAETEQDIESDEESYGNAENVDPNAEQGLEEPDPYVDDDESTEEEPVEPADDAGVGEITGVAEPTGVAELTGVGEPTRVDEHTGVGAALETVDEEDDDDTDDGPDELRYNLRARKPKNYSHLFDQDNHVLLCLLTAQMNVKKGLKLFEERGEDAVKKELLQVIERKVWHPVRKRDLTKKEKIRALRYLMYLKEKRNLTVKGRGCVDGRPQRVWKDKNDCSAPTVFLESLILSCVQDAKESRDVATVDIPGAFLHSDVDEIIHVKIEGDMALLLVKAAPEYAEYLEYENGVAVIYVELDKALYGTLQGAFLFWKNLSSFLISIGFELNPYDSCVANKNINGKQCTVLWHVDDLKISHQDPKVVDDVIAKLNVKYGELQPLTVTRGNEHVYLGMEIDYGVPGAVQIKMLEYTKEILADVPDDMNGTALTPAGDKLFDVEESEPLDKPTSEVFHTLTAKLLFLCKRSRPDLQLPVAYLSTRVRSPTVSDYKKLKRAMQYLRGTAHLFLTLEGTHDPEWWVDASYGVHPDMRSHTGGTMSMGYGSVYSRSTRQKLNTKSSTEAELVGVDDMMPMILWTRLFLQQQGWGCTKSTIIYQDNMSAMLLEKNGKRSSGRRTRHLDIRYFFVTDRIEKGELAIDYCPTDEMLADPFTKPLQGSKYRSFLRVILHWNPSKPMYVPGLDHRSVLDEGSTYDHEATHRHEATDGPTHGHEQATTYYEINE